MEIYPLPALKDNYIYVIRDPVSGQVAAVDPSEAGPVFAFLKACNWKLNGIFNTHHHWDHVGGNLSLKEAFGCRIWGAKKNASQIPGVDELLEEGGEISLGAERGKVWEIPGHTLGHLAYIFESSDVLFSGDTLFTLGCGRLFEGTPLHMWHSLQRLAALPEATRLFPGHEYTESNAEYAVTVEPENEDLKKRYAEVKRLRALGEKTVPGTIGEEKRTNPFLRAGDVTRFAALRAEKDLY
jgi:hydroxyacylglutathione hydrolase